MLLDEGHIDGMCRAAVRGGLAVEDALVLATHNGSRLPRAARLGAIAPGYRADFCLLSDDGAFARRGSITDGRLVAARR